MDIGEMIECVDRHREECSGVEQCRVTKADLLATLRLVPKLIAVVEAARNHRHPNVASSMTEPCRCDLCAALAALDAGEGV